MNEGSPDKLGSQAALDSPSPFKFPNKSAVEEQGVLKLRSQGRKSASAAKADETPSSDRAVSAKTPVHTSPPAPVAPKSPRSSRQELHASTSAVLSEVPALPLPADSRPKITIKPRPIISSSDTDSDSAPHVAERPVAASTTKTGRVSMLSSRSTSSSSRKVPAAAYSQLMSSELIL
jgi:hypothetical protein